MPVASASSDSAMHQVLDTLSDSTSSTTANDLDLIFLKGIMENPVAHEKMEETKLEAVRDNNVELVQEILRDLTPLTHRSKAADELARILKEPHFQAFVKCHFDYDPIHDNLIPCKEAGLKFNSGDILQIFNQEDLNWWQACHVEGGSAGLIPSQLLEEKRKAFVKRDLEFAAAGPLCAGMGGKKKKKMMYLTTKNAEFDRHELLIYEEVAKMPPFRRKTLVLIGAQGVGRRSLKNKLLVSDPQRYGTTVPYTSRKPKVDEKDGQMYLFMSRSEMESDIKNGRFLEHGEYDGNLYGTKINSIHEVVETGKVCILDVNPQALKILRTAEFLPYVVFIEAPDFEVLKAMNRSAIEAGVVTKQLTDSELKRTVEESARIQRAYGHYFDLTIINDNLENAFRKLKGALEKQGVEQQWVPVSWVF
uniref:MAGUK p55 scaffold protein 2b n=1 Tax=Scleropages formosus TaxID=113540 RepID=A0A8C9VZ79_SCLFO